MTKKKNKISSDKSSAAEPAVVKPAAVNSSLPAVSIIIPMYNAAEYIGECLNSLLGQTFKDFEVIVIDDCSTDNSAAIVKGYVSKFKGRLKLTKTSSNSGGGSVPRNKGLFFCKGEYVLFLNAEDFILLNALETLYTVAKSKNADVVYSGAYYDLRQADDVYVQRDGQGEQALMEAREDKSSLSGMELNKSIQQVIYEGQFWSTWTRFIRREFLIGNEITFPEIKIGGDYLWTLQICCCPKRLWRIPKPLYFRRSFVGKATIPESQLSLAFIDWLKALKELSSRLRILRENPAYCYEASKNYFKSGFFNRLVKEQGQLKIHELYSNLCRGKELSDPTLPFFFSAISDNTNDAKGLNTSRAYDSTHPLISVIIPLYNAADYVGECLESLLIQTFQDFEVIVVDDCSTDNGVEIVEGYLPKFNGRLRLTKTEKNSGGGGYVPRNIGFKLAGGKYVYFADADDFLLGTALETFYATAEENHTDIVYTAAHYYLEKPDDVAVLRDGTGKQLAAQGLEDKSALIVDDTDKILHGLIFDRGFSTQSKIANSFSNWVLSFADYAKALGELSNKIDILRENPSYSYEASTRYFNWCLNRTNDMRKDLTDQDIYEILYREFGKIDSANNLMVPFFFSMIDAARKSREANSQNVKRLKKEIEQLKKANTTRI